MNQLYSPTGTVNFMEFLKSHNIKTFIVSNNESCEVKKEYELVLTNNDITGDFIRKLAKAYYGSFYNPPHKPFDLYVALALVNGNPIKNECKVFYDSTFGTFVIGETDNSWEQTLSNLRANIPTTINPGDDDFTQNKVRAFQNELSILSTFHKGRSTALYSMNCYNVRFSSDATHKIQIVPKK